MKILLKFIFVFTFTSKVNASALVELGLCKDLDGTLKPIEKLICESSAALLESMNPSVEIPACNERQGPVMLSGDKPVSAVFVSCTLETLNSCSNIASSILQNMSGATVNVLVTSEGIADKKIMDSLLKLTDEAKLYKGKLNILPLNSAKNISYMRDPSVFTRNDSKTSLVNLPYLNQNIPASFVMNEAMKWCGIESTDTYKNLSSFNQAYDALVTENHNFSNENMQKEINGIKAINTEKTSTSTMGGNLLALPNGTIVTGYNDISCTSSSVLDYFSKKSKVLEVKIPNLYVGHVDEIFSIVPSNNKCGYAILQASPGEGIKFLEDTRKVNKPFLRVLDFSRMMADTPEKKAVGLKFDALFEEKRSFMDLNIGAPLPDSFTKRELKLINEMGELDGTNPVTSIELLSNEKLMKHWEKLEQESNVVVREILNELNQGSEACVPEVIKLPVFWDINTATPILPNPVNGLALNGSYFRSITKEVITGTGNMDNRLSHPDLDMYIDNKISHLFPKGIHKVDTGEHDSGFGNFHCATTNIYLPCK